MNRNPFVPDIRNLFRYAEAEIDDKMDFETIENFAKEALPEGFWLQEIELPTEKHIYFINGSKNIVANELERTKGADSEKAE